MPRVDGRVDAQGELLVSSRSVDRVGQTALSPASESSFLRGLSFMMWYTILGNFAIIGGNVRERCVCAARRRLAVTIRSQAAFALPRLQTRLPTFVRHTSTWLLMSPSSMATSQMGHRTVPGLSFLLEVPGVTVSAAGCLPPSLPAPSSSNRSTTSTQVPSHSPKSFRSTGLASMSSYPSPSSSSSP